MASSTIQHTTPEGITVTVFGELDARQREVLTEEALNFLGYLHTKQNTKRLDLLAARQNARARVAAGEQLDFEKSTHTIREDDSRSEEHTSELQSRGHLVCRLLLEKE